jgi:hypothetical protein
VIRGLPVRAGEGVALEGDADEGERGGDVVHEAQRHLVRIENLDPDAVGVLRLDS